MADEHPHRAIAENNSALRDCSTELRYLADAADILGQTKLAAMLSQVAHRIGIAERSIDRAVGQWISADVRAAEAGSRAVVEAAIAGFRSAS